MKMNRTKLVFPALVAFAILFESCAPKGSPISALGTPKFVPQSRPDSVIETGIGQDPATGGIFLQWYAAAGAAGYKVYRSNTRDVNNKPIDFSIVPNVPSSPNDTFGVDDNSLLVDTTYYYNVIAYAPDDVTLSAPSDTINYVLLARPVLSSPGQNAIVSASGLVLNWLDPTGGGPTEIRVQDISQAPPTYIWVSSDTSIYSNTGRVYFNFDQRATHGLISHHAYQWRVDRFNIDGTTGRQYEGARSAWGTFSVN